MPNYDFLCLNGHTQRDVRVPYGTRPPCPDCGGAVDILWQSSFPNVIKDECDFSTDNMTGQMERFTSRSEHRRRVKELGLRIRDEHNPPPGSDRSRYTSKWV